LAIANLQNQAGYDRGLVADLRFTANGVPQVIATDPATRATNTLTPGWEQPGFDDRAWPPAVALGAVGHRAVGRGLRDDRARLDGAVDLDLRPVGGHRQADGRVDLRPAQLRGGRRPLPGGGAAAAPSRRAVRAAR
jgi:hypothetical protein